MEEAISKLHRGQEINAMKTIGLVGNFIQMATPLGLPLNLNTSAVVIAQAKGRMAVEGFNSISSVWNGSPMKVKIDVRPT